MEQYRLPIYQCWEAKELSDRGSHVYSSEDELSWVSELFYIVSHYNRFHITKKYSNPFQRKKKSLNFEMTVITGT